MAKNAEMEARDKAGDAQLLSQIARDVTLSNLEVNTPIDFDAAMERAGVTEDDAIVGSIFELVDKAALVGVGFLIVECMINRDPTTEREYIIARCVTRESPSRMVVFTDGGSGFFETMKQFITARLDAGEPAWEGYYIRNGLRVSEYPVGKDGSPLTPDQIAAGVKPDSIGHTYYVA